MTNPPMTYSHNSQTQSFVGSHIPGVGLMVNVAVSCSVAIPVHMQHEAAWAMPSEEIAAIAQEIQDAITAVARRHEGRLSVAKVWSTK